jgi:hypothetical protein
MRVILLIFLASLNLFTYSQVKTEAYFGSPNKWEQANDILQLYDKGYYITGGFEGDPYHYGWNIKTDINLEMLYDKVLEHDLSTVAQFASTNDEKGNIYTTGFTTYSGQWPFVIKIDSCGNKSWCKILQYDGDFDDGVGIDIIINNNNDIIVLTSFDSGEEIDKIHLVGLNENGDVLWKKPYASRNNHSWIKQPIARSIIEYNDEYYISGNCDWPFPNDTTHWFLRPFFIGIDSLFEEKWILPFAPLDSVFGHAYNSIPLNDSIFMGIGERWLEGLSKNSILMFYDKDGEELGYNQIRNDSIGPNIIANVSRDIERINDSLFITFSIWGSTPEDGICSEMVIDTAGKIYNINESTYCTGSGSLIKTYDNNYVYAVTVEETKSDWDIYVYKRDENLNDVPFDPTPHNYDSLCPGGIQSGTTDITDCFIWTDIGESLSPSEYFASLNTILIKAYPNPVNGNEVTFELQNTEYHDNMELKCFDLFGKLVHSEKVYQHQGESKVNIENWNKGIYFAIIFSENKNVGSAKFVVQ